MKHFTSLMRKYLPMLQIMQIDFLEKYGDEDIVFNVTYQQNILNASCYYKGEFDSKNDFYLYGGGHDYMTELFVAKEYKRFTDHVSDVIEQIIGRLTESDEEFITKIKSLD